MEETRIRIGGMSCEGCVRNISGVLTALAGVDRAEISLSAQEGVVSFDSAKVSRAELVAAIEDAGFDAA